MFGRNKMPDYAKLFSSLIIGAVLVGCSSDSDNDDSTNTNITTINVALDALQQVPSTTSVASATGSVSLDNTTRLLTGSVTSSNMTISVAHIHTGEAGFNGDVVVALEVDGDTAAVPENTVLTAEQVTAMLNGDYYINLHSERYPGGEVRGQIVPDNIQVLAFTVSGESETPPLNNVGSGTGYVTLRDSAMSVSAVVVSTTDSPASAAHLHAGYTGENGGVLFGLEADSAVAGRFAATSVLSEDNYQQVKSGGSYLNLHTQANPGGELRGQLLPDGIRVYSAALTGGQEVPAVTTAASGSGYVTMNMMSYKATAIINTADLSGATMAHIHAGERGANGDVIVGLTKNAENDAVWEVRNGSLTAAQAKLISSGQSYFNVHTETYPGGELRGQIVPGPYASSASGKVREQSAAFVQTFLSNSGAELAPFYTEDATLTLPGQSTVTGRDNIAAAWQGAFTDGGLRAVRLNINSVEPGASAEQYIERGNYSLDVVTPDGPDTLESTYVVTWSVPADGSTALITDDQINP